MGEIHGMILSCAEETKKLSGPTRILDGAEDDPFEECRIDGI